MDGSAKRKLMLLNGLLEGAALSRLANGGVDVGIHCSEWLLLKGVVVVERSYVKADVEQVERRCHSRGFLTEDY